MYTLNKKRYAIKLLSISLLNVDRFSELGYFSATLYIYKDMARSLVACLFSLTVCNPIKNNAQLQC